MLNGTGLLLVTLLVVGIAGPAVPVTDSPRIVQWHKIGSAGLGMTRAAVERTYGSPSYPGLGPEVPQYEVPGGVLFIGYRPPCDDRGRCRGRVDYVATNSRRYRTSAGLGVGTWIRFPDCTSARTGICVRKWNGYRLGKHPGTGVPVWWRWATYAGRPVTAFLDVTGAGLPPYRPVGTGEVFELGFIDGRVPASYWR